MVRDNGWMPVNCSSERERRDISVYCDKQHLAFVVLLI